MTRLQPQAAVPGLCLLLAFSGATLLALVSGARCEHAERDPAAPGVFRLPPAVTPRLLADAAHSAPADIEHVRSSTLHGTYYQAVQYSPRRIAHLPPVVDAVPQRKVSSVLRRTPPVDTAQPLERAGRQVPEPITLTPARSGNTLQRTPSIESVPVLPQLTPPVLNGLVPEPAPSVSPDPGKHQPAPPSDRTPPETVPSLMPLATAPLLVEQRPQRLPSELPPPRRPASPALATVARRADQLVDHGTRLAERRAYFSARSEFLEALSLMAQALDMDRGEQVHSASLAEGLRALEEAQDFVAYGSKLEADLDVTQIAKAHRTPVLEGTDEPIAPLSALQQYYSFAQRKLAVAAGQQPAASRALYALGKLQTAMAREPLGGTSYEARAMVFHQAALAADQANAGSANEFGVLLARCGQYEDAKRVLLQSLSLQQSAEVWHNLAVVHDALGEHDLAASARYELKLRQDKDSSDAPSGASEQPAVQWMEPTEFARRSGASRWEQ